MKLWLPQNQKPPLGAQINWGDPITSGLVGCQLFNAGSGDLVYDLVAQRNTSTLTAFGGDSPGWRVGDHGHVAYVDGQSYAAATVPLGTTNTITLMARIRLESSLTSYGGIVVTAGAPVTGIVQNVATGNLSWLWAGTFGGAGGPALQAVGEWQLITMVVAPDAITIYVNTTSAQWVRASSAISLSGVWNFGTERDANRASRYMDGDIDFAAIWARALSSKEVARIVGL